MTVETPIDSYFQPQKWEDDQPPTGEVAGHAPADPWLRAREGAPGTGDLGWESHGWKGEAQF